MNVQRFTAKGDIVPHTTTVGRTLLVLPRVSIPGGGMIHVKEITQGGFGHIGTERKINTPDNVKVVVGPHDIKNNYFKNIYKKNYKLKPTP